MSSGRKSSFLIPGLLGDQRRFARVFRTPIEKQGNGDRRELLTRRIRPFLLRRTKGEVGSQLPPKTEIVQHVELAGDQRDLYETVRLAMHERIRRGNLGQGLRAQPDRHPRRAAEAAPGLLRPAAGQAGGGATGPSSAKLDPAHGHVAGAGRGWPARAAVLAVHQHARPDPSPSWSRPGSPMSSCGATPRTGRRRWHGSSGARCPCS